MSDCIVAVLDCRHDADQAQRARVTRAEVVSTKLYSNNSQQIYRACHIHV
ncbi:MAG: hypothetical protein QF636_05520 [Arenicellales bacterium]|nr:hypothetical protein [Arenicellales bacterium]MDP7569495.1 hypothetical protein [Arenicellales bacterium]